MQQSCPCQERQLFRKRTPKRLSIYRFGIFFHGENDQSVDVSRSRDFVAQLEAVGGSPRYNEIVAGNHAIWNQIYYDFDHELYGLYQWMFAQSRNGSPRARWCVGLVGDGRLDGRVPQVSSAN